ncbi:MAG: NADH-quinone oxidoreductase subunit D [candidate division FCPU426 bacterium]
MELKDKFPDSPRDEAEEFDIEPMYINMGPSHPAMHGTVKLVLKLDGERVVGADMQIGYLHRCFEKTVEHKTWNQAIPYTDRLNYVSPLINNVGYALAVENLLAIEVPERCQYIRVIMSELSRIGDHLTCIGASAMELGALTAFLYFIKAREYTWQLIEEVTGARLTISYTRVGGVVRDLPANFEERFDWIERQILENVDEVRALLEKNRIFIDRMKGVGVMKLDRVMSYGMTGPFARASGLNYDVRKAAPYLVYDRMDFIVPTATEGDNFARYQVRIQEIFQSLRIIRQALKEIPEGPIRSKDPRVSLPPKKEVYSNIEALMNHFKLLMPGHGIRPAKGEVYQAVEGGNGELGFWVISDGTDRPYRVRVRPPCFPITAGVEELVLGENLADIVPIFGSVNMIGGELDR